jgi:hypothetical protein
MSSNEDRIPTLTDVVALEESVEPLTEEELEELQADISARVLRLAEDLVHSAAREVEDVIFSRIFDQLRMQLPGIIDQVLKDRLIK